MKTNKSPILIECQYDTLKNSRGQIWYEGRINKKEKIPHGNGKRFYSNGDVFYGQFRDGKPIKGCLLYNRGMNSIEGQLKDGMFSGQCVLRSAQRDNVKPIKMSKGFENPKEPDVYYDYVKLMQMNLIQLSELQNTKVYVSPLNFLSKPNFKPKREQIMEQYFRARKRRDQYQHIFPLNQGIVQYGKQAIIHVFECQSDEQNKIIEHRLKQYFIDWCNIEEKQGCKYVLPQFTVRIAKRHTKQNHELNLCYELKNIVFKIVHQAESIRDKIGQMEAEVVNCVVYSRNTLELIDDKL